ncbi:MAG: hypothetical protein AAFY71_17490 [Bacteroidota bacterium]
MKYLFYLTLLIYSSSVFSQNKLRVFIFNEASYLLHFRPEWQRKVMPEVPNENSGLSLSNFGIGIYVNLNNRISIPVSYSNIFFCPTCNEGRKLSSISANNTNKAGLAFHYFHHYSSGINFNVIKWKENRFFVEVTGIFRRGREQFFGIDGAGEFRDFYTEGYDIGGGLKLGIEISLIPNLHLRLAPFYERFHRNLKLSSPPFLDNRYGLRTVVALTLI